MDDSKLRWGTAVFLFTAIGLLVLLIGLGVFDPKPLGKLQWQKSVAALTVAGQARSVLWLADGVEGVFSVRGTAVYQTGETDIVYGLVLGSEDDYLAVVVSPLGYVTLWQGEHVWLPLQTWPHVRTGHEPNEIWVDVAGEEITVRLNREILWVGQGSLAGGVGVIGESWGETAVVQFPSIQLFAP